MQEFKSFSERILKLKKEQFESLALELFQFQSKANPLYREYLRIRRVNVEEVKSLDQIPFLPIRFFKDHPVICGKPEDFKHFYSSSGTTGMITSKHYIWSEDWYLRHARQIFESTYGSLNDYHVLALLPAYLERPGSSLVAMAQHFIQVSDSEHSGFYLYNHDELLQKVNKLRHGSRKILLLGVTFALLDLADSNEPLDSVDNLMVMETGGMKGRRKEMIREEVHDTLKSYFGVESIHSEYGMTEMMSQAYSKGQGKYQLPASVQIMLRDINDPWSWATRSQGGINVIDLGNFHSCAFLETQDLGRFDEDGNLEVLGRIDNSEIRGCNLLVQ
jgi:phenylacetate-coenzyme A ligase PaaK-like adenylate-forming protein